MSDIAADEHVEVIKAAKFVVNREQIEQALCRVIALAVSGIDDGNYQYFPVRGNIRPGRSG